jgi:penicillin-binding protein 1C
MKHWWILFLAVVTACVFRMEAAGTLPSFADVRAAHVKSDSLLLDRQGTVLHELRTDRQGRRLDWTDLAEISPSLLQAVICSEDKRFFTHGGVDYRALGAAALGFLSGSGLRGASTITMQLASFLDRSTAVTARQRTITQKTAQIRLARDIEKRWSKNEILEAYLNLVTFRGEYTGVSAASRGLFGKEPHGLDQAQSLLLASLIRAPNAGARTLEARARNLGGRLGWQISDAALAESLQCLTPTAARVEPRAAWAPHAARRLLAGRPPGTHLRSTLDARLQKFAFGQLARQVEALAGSNVRQGALLVLENRTGEVLAYASYTSQAAGTYVDGVQALRQTGSTLKPFLYATALDQRILTARSLLDDSPLDVSTGGGLYQPENYDASFHGPVSVRVALASSLNVPAVRTLALVGTEPFLKVLRQLGIRSLTESGDYYGLALALGSADISLWDLANAYRALANGGVWSEACLTPAAGRTAARRKQAFSPEAAFIVSDILADREARSETFGLENPLGTRFWTAVKTGTSKDMRDNWCIGYSSRYTVGVWMGNFAGDSMWNVSGITGAAPLWNDIMNELHHSNAGRPPAPPRGLVRVAPADGKGRAEWFLAGTQPAAAAGDDRNSPRIVYPPSGTIIALDPDIPAALQKVGFVARADSPARWLLNEKLLKEEGSTILWTPTTGRHVLAIIDGQNAVVDSVAFEVR